MAEDNYSIASLILGIFAVVTIMIPYLNAILGILAIVFGFISINKKSNPLAIIGIVLGFIPIVFMLFFMGGMMYWGYSGRTWMPMMR